MRATMMLADYAQIADGKLHLTPGRRYSWVLDVDGHADDSWQLSFETRQAG